MKCPKCGKPMTKAFCLYCGYMENGNTITKTEKNPSATDIEIYLGDRFDTICHNENTFLIFFLGPFYFCFNRLLFLGVFCAIIDILFYFFCITTFDLSIFKFLLLFIMVRVFYMTCSNMIYMKIYSKKIEKIKLKNPINLLILLAKNPRSSSKLSSLISKTISLI